MPDCKPMYMKCVRISEGASQDKKKLTRSDAVFLQIREKGMRGEDEEAGVGEWDGGDGPRGGDESVVSGQRSVTSRGAAGDARAGTMPASTEFMRGEMGEAGEAGAVGRRFQRRALDGAGVSAGND